MKKDIKPSNNIIKLSVIIPMHNVEKIIDRCLKSLESQDIQNIQYLFIDDCSTDNTISKVSAWIAKNNNKNTFYKIISNETNQGVAATRNIGLSHALGSYIYYIDADDFIEPQTLKILYQLAEEKQADIVGCEWYLSFKQNERYMQQSDVKTGEDLFKKITRGKIRWNLWLFLVKRKLYEDHKVRFIPQMNMGEDMMVMSKLALIANNVYIHHQPLYHYVQSNSNSLTKQYEKGFYQIKTNIKEIELFIKSKQLYNLIDDINFMKLNVKLPFLISHNTKDYLFWLNCFPEANEYIEKNKDCPCYTRIIQLAAKHKQFWVLKLYYWTVIKVIYGCIYK